MTITVKIDVEVTEEDVKDILITACEGGINYWCPRVEKFGISLDDDIYEHFVKGGALRFWEDEDETGENLVPHDITYLALLDALKMFIEESGIGCVYDNRLDVSCLDSVDADAIVQYAIFEDVVYG